MLPSLRSIRNTLLVLILVAIPILLLQSSRSHPNQLNAFERTVRRISRPMEASASYMANTLRRFFERWFFQAKLQEENERLLREVQQLNLQLQQFTQVREENLRLRRSLDVREKASEDMVAAEVSSVEQSPFLRVIKISIRQGDIHVAPGMAVISDVGVVGRIDKVSNQYSDVMLITDPRSKLAIESVDSRIPGILEGADEARCIARFTPSEKTLQVGDIIQTSGTDQLFPAGRPVGQIVKVWQEVGKGQFAEVIPFVRFDQLRMVWVVFADAPTPDPDAGQTFVSPTGRGLAPIR